jgi:hypothetical protein
MRHPGKQVRGTNVASIKCTDLRESREKQPLVDMSVWGDG